MNERRMRLSAGEQISLATRSLRQGYRAIRQPGLRRFVLLPMLFAGCVLLPGLYLTVQYANSWVVSIAAWLPEWLQFLTSILTFLIYASALLIGAWLFSLLALLVCGPFLGVLSQRVLQLHHASPDSAGHARPLWLEVTAALGREWRKLRYQVPRILVLVVVSFIPLLNVVAPALWLIYGCWMMAVQFTDYGAENTQRTFDYTLSLLHRHRWAALAFGAPVAALLAVPLLGIVIVPIATAGGTLLWSALEQRSAE